ncbi:MAG: hypothetical protein P9L92_02240 [Candidatus Electryonea clarkiae]|nr:hypothetical protein [Candidatus Electryonea clarkiae]MDP8287320.1 hypothetical protein [Candidatus Electryonea clarkiae]
MAEKKTGTKVKIDTKAVKKRTGKGKYPESKFTWSLGKRNLYMLIIALAVIIVGYLFLGHGPHDSISSRTIAPVILIIGYLFLVPLAIIIRDPSEDKN